MERVAELLDGTADYVTGQDYGPLRAVELGGGGEVLMEGPELAHEKRSITQPLAPDPAPEVVNLLKVLFLKSLSWG